LLILLMLYLLSSSSFYFIFSLFFFYDYAPHRDLHSFPTRRSSDLYQTPEGGHCEPDREPVPAKEGADDNLCQKIARDSCEQGVGDRKSTRLNSSHLVISYAVFCLKKKKKKKKKKSRMITERYHIMT